MGQLLYESEATEVVRQLPKGPRLGVIGSSSFWGGDSRDICGAVGAQLSQLEDLVLLTGGVPGVGEAVGRAFVEARRGATDWPTAYHLLPRGSSSWDYGVTLFCGSTMLDRREILGRLAGVYLAIEGGPGTAHEAQIVQSRGGVIIPVGRTGGFSAEIYNQLEFPNPAVEADWEKLNNGTATVGQVAGAVRRIVESLLRPGG